MKLRILKKPKTKLVLQWKDRFILYGFLISLFILLSPQFIFHFPYGDENHPHFKGDHTHEDEGLKHTEDIPIHIHRIFLSTHHIPTKKIYSLLVHSVIFLIMIILLFNYILGIV
jgi:hypothetical protein